MVYGTADEDLLTVLVMFRYGELSSFGILATEKQNEIFQTYKEIGALVQAQLVSLWFCPWRLGYSRDTYCIGKVGSGWDHSK